jgi:uncharacterized protein YjbI with pentapeptide repeats
MMLRQNEEMNADLFAIDKERDREANRELNDLGDSTQTSDITEKLNRQGTTIIIYCSFMEALDRHKHSPLYLRIKSMLVRGEKLTMREFVYFAMTTEDTNVLNLELLRAAVNCYSGGFSENLAILLAIREWQNASSNDKEARAKQIVQALKERCNRITINFRTYLNLHGINLDGLDLSKGLLDYADLCDAKLTNTRLCDTSFYGCLLTNADFSNATCKSINDREYFGATFSSASACNAKFDGFDAGDSRFNKCDLSDASFKNGVVNGYFNHACLKDVDFTGTTLGFMGHYNETVGCDLSGAELWGANVIDVDFMRVDFSLAKFFNQDALLSADNLNAAIQKLQDKMRPVMDEHTIKHYKNAVAASLTNSVHWVLSERQIDLLTAAANHPFFQPESPIQQWANSAYQGMYSLFSSTPAVHYYQTPAVKLFEDEINKVKDVIAGDVYLR